jgi:hypothetical protein
MFELSLYKRPQIMECSPKQCNDTDAVIESSSQIAGLSTGRSLSPTAPATPR